MESTLLYSPNHKKKDIRDKLRARKRNTFISSIMKRIKASKKLKFKSNKSYSFKKDSP